MNRFLFESLCLVLWGLFLAVVSWVMWGPSSVLPEVAQSCPTFVTPWTVAYKAPLSMEFSRQEYWSASPYPSPGDLPDPGIKPTSPASLPLQAGSLPLSYRGSPRSRGSCVELFEDPRPCVLSHCNFGSCYPQPCPSSLLVLLAILTTRGQLAWA